MPATDLIEGSVQFKDDTLKIGSILKLIHVYFAVTSYQSSLSSLFHVICNLSCHPLCC